MQRRRSPVRTEDLVGLPALATVESLAFDSRRAPRQTYAVMRRATAAALVFFVALAGVAFCARGVQACAALMAAAPDCCKNEATLAATDCCCPAKGGRQAAFLPAGELVKAAAFDPLAAHVDAALDPVPTPHSLVVVWSHPPRALAPPDTPITLHTSLLL